MGVKGLELLFLEVESLEESLAFYAEGLGFEVLAHAAMVFAREGLAPSHFARRSAWAQEIVFWSSVAGGSFGVYVLLTAF